MSSTRKRSCTACVAAKRKCSLDLPSCQRCVTRGMGCMYPWMALLQSKELSQQSTYSNATQSPALELYYDTATASSAPVAVPSNTLPWPLVPGMLSQVSALASQKSHVPLGNIEGFPATRFPIMPDLPVSAADMSVYLNRDWAPEGPISQGSVLQPRAEYAARRFANQCLAFAQLGQTAFIHHTQVEASEFLQDTFAASALNAMRNVNNATVVRREINRRVNRLRDWVRARLDPVSANASENGQDLLPALQSMIVYQCIRLFSDTEISQRALAESDLELLRALISHLVSSVKSFSENGQWFLWIKEESLRRTILVAELVIGVYSFLKQGWDQAETRLSRLGFTAQSSLWEARSSEQWEDAWRCQQRYQVHLLSWEQDMCTARSGELEELGILIRGTYLGLDKLEEWLVWEHRALIRWGLRGA